jgi:hypothetical protein
MDRLPAALTPAPRRGFCLWVFAADIQLAHNSALQHPACMGDYQRVAVAFAARIEERLRELPPQDRGKFLLALARVLAPRC